MPGYRYVRRTVVPGLRGSALARTLAFRIFAAGPGTKRSPRLPSDITGGNLLGGIGVERLPVVLLLLLGASPERIGEVAEEVAAVQVLSAGFRPVFVIDTPAFGPIRRFGYVVELVMPRGSWTAEEPWSDYLCRRIASMVTQYGAWTMISVGPDGLGESGRAALEILH